MITFEQRYGIRYVHADGTPVQPDVQADIDAALAAAHRRGWEEALEAARKELDSERLYLSAEAIRFLPYRDPK